MRKSLIDEQILRDLQSIKRLSGLSYSEIARRIGANVAYVSRILRGEVTLTVPAVERLAHAMDMKLEVNFRSFDAPVSLEGMDEDVDTDLGTEAVDANTDNHEPQIESQSSPSPRSAESETRVGGTPSRTPVAGSQIAFRRVRQDSPKQRRGGFVSESEDAKLRRSEEARRRAYDEQVGDAVAEFLKARAQSGNAGA